MLTKTPAKTCPKCFRHLPVTEFRFLNKSKRRRASECKRCRNRRLRGQRSRQGLADFKDAVAEVRRSESVERIRGILDGLIQRLGGAEKFMEMWTGLIADTDSPGVSRVKALETITHAMIVADREEFSRGANFADVDPVEFAMFLHDRKQLAPMVRAALADGILSWDQIDPPPEGSGA